MESNTLKELDAAIDRLLEDRAHLIRRMGQGVVVDIRAFLNLQEALNILGTEKYARKQTEQVMVAATTGEARN